MSDNLSIYVERASMEDLLAIWKIDGNEQDIVHRQNLMRTVENRNCLIAKQGQHVIGFAVQDTQVFECPFVMQVKVLSQDNQHEVIQKLLEYIEETTPTGRVLVAATEKNASLQQILGELDYQVSGRLYYVYPNEVLVLFVKLL